MRHPVRASRDGWDCHVHVFDAAAPVLGGHYRPATHTLAQIEAVAAAAGVGHLVLVQPSVYGHDHSLLLEALRAGAGRHRGVAVLGAGVTDAELDSLHAAGVRGVRFNQVSPVGGAADPAATLQQLAPRLRERGWHVQWYVPATQLPALVPLQAHTGLTFVLDHLAGMTAAMAEDPADTTNTHTTHAAPPEAAAAWQALATLAAGGAWVKLSGWYRLQGHAPVPAQLPESAPFHSLHATLRRVATLFGHRTVWGSDWPHTSLGAGNNLPYAATWQPVADVLPTPAAAAVRTMHPKQLYG